MIENEASRSGNKPSSFHGSDLLGSQIDALIGTVFDTRTYFRY